MKCFTVASDGSVYPHITVKPLPFPNIELGEPRLHSTIARIPVSQTMFETMTSKTPCPYTTELKNEKPQGPRCKYCGKPCVYVSKEHIEHGEMWSPVEIDRASVGLLNKRFFVVVPEQEPDQRALVLLQLNPRYPDEINGGGTYAYESYPKKSELWDAEQEGDGTNTGIIRIKTVSCYKIKDGEVRNEWPHLLAILWPGKTIRLSRVGVLDGEPAMYIRYNGTNIEIGEKDQLYPVFINKEDEKGIELI